MMGEAVFGSGEDLLMAVLDFVLTQVLVWNTVVQLGAVAVAFCAAYWGGKRLQAPLERRLSAYIWVEGRLEGVVRVAATRLLMPILALPVLWIASDASRHLGWTVSLIEAAQTALAVWVVAGLLSSQIRNQTWTRAVTSLIVAVAVLDTLNLLPYVTGLLDHIDFDAGPLHFSLLSLGKGLGVLVVLVWLAHLLSGLCEHRICRLPDVSPTAQVLLGKSLRFLFFLAAFIVALHAMGINLSGLALFSGGIGLGIGFGLQKLVSNLLSGLIILLDKSIKPGDVIEVGGTYGHINHLGARYISVVTRDEKEYLIPNEELITGQVVNWSHSSNLVRVKVPLGVSYDEDPRRTIALVEEAAGRTPRVLCEPAPVCLLTSFGESTVNFEIRFWIMDPHNGVTNVRSELLLNVWDRFKEHGIEIPYPQCVIHYRPLEPPPSFLRRG